MNKKEKIVEKLKEIYDPEIPLSLWELGLIYNIEINERNVNILMTLTSPQCPMSDYLIEMIKDKLIELEFIDEVNVNLTFDPPWTPEMIKEEKKNNESNIINKKSESKLGNNEEKVNDVNIKICHSCGVDENIKPLIEVRYKNEKFFMCYNCLKDF